MIPISSSSRDPFRHSVLGGPALARLSVVVGVLALLWVAIAWAVAIP